MVGIQNIWQGPTRVETSSSGALSQRRDVRRRSACGSLCFDCVNLKSERIYAGRPRAIRLSLQLNLARVSRLLCSDKERTQQQSEGT